MQRVLRIGVPMLCALFLIGCSTEEGPSAPTNAPKATGNEPPPAAKPLSPDIKPPGGSKRNIVKPPPTGTTQATP